MKWISVKDRLPEIMTNCLVYYCEYWNSEQHRKIAWAYFNSESIFIADGRINPTHWMPLPDPPKDII